MDRTRALLWCGVPAGPAFVATFLAEGAVRDGYDPLRHPVSSLALGPRGAVQTANFVVTGALYLAAAAGMWRSPRRSATVTVLIGAAGAGLVGSGVFVTDPVSGYPPGTPDLLPGYSGPTAALHDAFAVPVFLGLPAAALVEAYRSRADRGWARYSAATALVMAVTFVGAGAGFAQSPAVVRYGGLFQRACVTAGFGWLTALAVRTLRVRRRG